MKPLEITRTHDLGMLNAEAQVLSVARQFGRLECIQRHVHRAVSDSMKPDLKAGFGALDGHSVEFSLVVSWNAGIAGIIGVRSEKSRCPGPERAVHESLQHARMQHRVARWMSCAVLFQNIEVIIEREPFADANVQSPFSLHLLEHEKIVPRGIVLHGSDAVEGGIRRGKFESTAALDVRRGRYVQLDQVNRSFANDAGQFAVWATIEFASPRIRRISGDSRSRQGRAVRNGNVSINSTKNCRMARSDRVQVGAGRKLLVLPQGVIPAIPDDPLAWRRQLHARLNSLLHLRQRLHAYKIDVQFLETSGCQMHVRVIEAGHHETSIEVDHF